MICYPAQGWTITEQREVRIDVPGAESFPAGFMRTELSAAEELVLHWFQPEGRWPAPTRREYLMRILDKLLGHPGYAFVRISLRRPPSRGEVSEDDLEALESMAVALAPWARDALTVGPER
jgi:Protein of unknown function (DUF3485)